MDADARASAAAAERQWDDLHTEVDMNDVGGPFEGPEKLLELWFAPSAEELPECQRAAAERGAVLGGRIGLRRVPKSTWEGMLELVKCKTLSVETGVDVDAYLLSESSMFVFPHKLILKTCGTTTLLLGLERILRIAKATIFDEESLSLHASSVSSAMLAHAVAADADAKQLGAIVYRCFYSRKSFMFPEKQKGPHRDWTQENELLDRYFDNGSAYTVGQMNGDHWLLYMAQGEAPELCIPTRRSPARMDMTLEILMTELSPAACKRFIFDEPRGTSLSGAHELGAEVSDAMGLKKLFKDTQLDAFAFEPCGYSANALVTASAAHSDGYWTVHVTPEPGSSYASFETNVALDSEGTEDAPGAPVSSIPSLVHRVVAMFEPGSFTFTLFVSEEAETALEPLLLFQLEGYMRSDRILYGFKGYDLLFLSFQRQ